MSLKPKRTNLFEPIKSKDLGMARLVLGVGYNDLRYLLGGTSKTIAQGKDNERILPPNLGILVRLLLNSPMDNPLPTDVDFNHIRERFGPAYYKTEKGAGRDQSMPKTHASVMTGTRRAAGTSWSSESDNRVQPSPQTRRLLWVLNQWADKYGEDEVWRRWVEAADQEAQARGSDLVDVLRTGSWPVLEGEGRFKPDEENEQLEN